MYKAWFKYGRIREFAGLSLGGVTPQIRYQMTMDGKARWGVDGRIPQPEDPGDHQEPINPGQVASPEIAEIMTFQNGSPVWSVKLWAAHKTRLDAGLSVSPPHYPHSSEDLQSAWSAFAGEFQGNANVSWAVWSSISPWVESKLFYWGGRDVTTVDYNVPILEAGPASSFGIGCKQKTLNQADLLDRYATHMVQQQQRNRDGLERDGGGMFDMVVSFSGVEHDGLGRYGDPIHPSGDLAALREIFLSLKHGGLLFLAVPIASEDIVHKHNHRIYGPRRLPMLARGFQVLGWVWDGEVVKDHSALKNSTLYETPKLSTDGKQTQLRGDQAHGKSWRYMKIEHHQPVLVLQRPPGPEGP